MRESGNIFNWLGMKREQEILSLSTQHVISVLMCAKTFQEAVEKYAEGDQGAKLALIEKVRSYEHSADQMRIEMVRRISEGVISPVDREELLKFALTVDRIADWTNGAARMLVFLEKPLPNGITDNIHASSVSIVRAIEDLKGAIDALLSSKNQEAIERSLAANRIESEEDDRKQDTLSKILHAKISTPELLVVYNLAEQLEGITDKVEDASDFVRIIAVKSK